MRKIPQDLGVLFRAEHSTFIFCQHTNQPSQGSGNALKRPERVRAGEWGGAAKCGVWDRTLLWHSWTPNSCGSLYRSKPVKMAAQMGRSLHGPSPTEELLIVGGFLGRSCPFLWWSGGHWQEAPALVDDLTCVWYTQAVFVGLSGRQKKRDERGRRE